MAFQPVAVEVVVPERRGFCPDSERAMDDLLDYIHDREQLIAVRTPAASTPAAA